MTEGVIKRDLSIVTVAIPSQTSDNAGAIRLTNVPKEAKIIMPELAGYCYRESNAEWYMIVRQSNSSGLPYTNATVQAFTCHYII
jgi:hypothetical protein